MLSLCFNTLSRFVIAFLSRSKRLFNFMAAVTICSDFDFTCAWELTHWKRPWCWEGLGAGGEGDDRGWDGWMASLTRRTWVWVNNGSLWWTGRPGVLRFMGSQRVGHDWAELNWTVHERWWYTTTTGDNLNLECGAYSVLSFGLQLHFWDINKNLIVCPVT